MNTAEAFAQVLALHRSQNPGITATPIAIAGRGDPNRTAWIDEVILARVDGKEIHLSHDAIPPEVITALTGMTGPGTQPNPETVAATLAHLAERGALANSEAACVAEITKALSGNPGA